jgi:SAM-dependent MidA family methyltransferase
MWVESAYGATGFWPRNLPGQHFRTAAATGGLATLLSGILDAQPQITALIDIGAGAGELLTELGGVRTDLQLTGVDIRRRPAALPSGIDWVQAGWDVCGHRWSGNGDRLLRSVGRPTLVVCAEWLDDLPGPVVEWAGGDWRQVHVAEDGQESLGEPVTGEDRSWLERWWRPGKRAEVGRTRDRAWTELVRSVRPSGGCVLMIDYGHRAHTRPHLGSLAAYQHGRRTSPRPAPGVNLTAHVAVDAVQAAGESLGASTVHLVPQAQVVRELAVTATSSDPLEELAQRSRRSALSAAQGLGAHWWLLQR